MSRSVWVHLALAVAWTLLTVPTVLWWRDSVFWVSLMTVYGLVGLHLAAVEGGRDKTGPEILARLDRIERKLS